MKKRKVIIDCDPGLDDALALLVAVAAEELDILAVTTVAGNSTIENTTENALDLLEFYGRPDIMVSRGSGKPILHRFNSAGAVVHGVSGLGDIQIPKAKNSEVNKRAHEVIYEILMKSDEKVTIIALGPLTNIAITMHLYPEVLEKIELISMMGGTCYGGNLKAVTEANIDNDPEAAYIVVTVK